MTANLGLLGNALLIGFCAAFPYSYVYVVVDHAGVHSFDLGISRG